MARKSKTVSWEEKQAAVEYDDAQKEHQDIVQRRRAAQLEVELAEAAVEEAEERAETAREALERLEEEESEADEAATEAYKKLGKLQVESRGEVEV